MKIIKRDKSIIPACDKIPLEKLEEIVKVSAKFEEVGAYKIGFYLGLKYSLPRIVEIIRKYTQKPIIYDHQKAGTDIPDMGRKLVELCKEIGIDALIIFPQSGPETEKSCIEAAKEYGIGILVGGLMTHPKYKRSEGGFIEDKAIMEIYSIAANLGVDNFVVPGNKPDEIKRIREFLIGKGINPTFYAPGFISQGGKLSEAAKVAGDNWHAIIGRAIYNAENIEKAILELSKEI